MPYIYKITSPTGKVYIGSTVKPKVEHRWISYKSLKCKQQRKIYHSLIKHGVESHVFEVVTECTIEDMLRLECVYGEWFDVLGENGLNLALPKSTDTYSGIAEETREKIRQKSKKQFESEERRKFLSHTKKQWFVNNKEKASKGIEKSIATRNTLECRKKNSEQRLNFIKNNPEKWAEMQRKTIEKTRSIENREIRSKGMKEWIKNNPQKYNEILEKSIAARKTAIGIENNRKAQKLLYENGYKNPRCKKVICKITGNIWDSVNEAAIELGYKRSTLTGKLNGSKKNNTSLIYY